MKCKQMTAYRWQYNPWLPKYQVELKVSSDYKMELRTSLLCLRFFRTFLRLRNIVRWRDYLDLVKLVIGGTKYM